MGSNPQLRKEFSERYDREGAQAMFDLLSNVIPRVQEAAHKR